MNRRATIYTALAVALGTVGSGSSLAEDLFVVHQYRFSKEAVQQGFNDNQDFDSGRVKAQKLMQTVMAFALGIPKDFRQSVNSRNVDCLVTNGTTLEKLWQRQGKEKFRVKTPKHVRALQVTIRGGATSNQACSQNMEFILTEDIAAQVTSKVVR